MKKKKKDPFPKFIKEFSETYCERLRQSHSWKDDFLEQYGFVWTRWNCDKSAKIINDELLEYLRQKEIIDRDGIFYVKVKGDKIRILCRSKENLDMWHKILFLRLCPATKILVTEIGSLSFEIELTDIEKRILNENSVSSGIRA